MVLSDAKAMGYLQFVAGIPVNGSRWLYSDKPYKLATPALSVITSGSWRWITANCCALSPASPGASALPLCRSLLALVGDNRPWPQMRGYPRRCVRGTVEQRCSCPARI